MAAYDDAAGVTAQFNKNVLHVLNTQLGGDFDPDLFTHVAIWNEDEQWIEMRLRAKEAAEVTLREAGISVHFDRGEDLLTEISAKFTPERVEKELSAAGFVVDGMWGADEGSSSSRWPTPTADCVGVPGIPRRERRQHRRCGWLLGRSGGGQQLRRFVAPAAATAADLTSAAAHDHDAEDEQEQGRSSGQDAGHYPVGRAVGERDQIGTRRKQHLLRQAAGATRSGSGGPPLTLTEACHPASQATSRTTTAGDAVRRRNVSALAASDTTEYAGMDRRRGAPRRGDAVPRCARTANSGRGKRRAAMGRDGPRWRGSRRVHRSVPPR